MRDMNELHDTCDKACAILKQTNDGDLLTPSDLKLTEYAVNGHLNDEGKKAFEALYERVTQGAYIKPFLNGVEPFTIDHEGYVNYKGIYVEHFSRWYAYSENAKQDLIELGRRCRFLERKGVEVNSGSAVWHWEEYEDEYAAERQAELDDLLERFGARGVNYAKIKIAYLGRSAEYFTFGCPTDLEDIRNHPIAGDFISRNRDDEYSNGYKIILETYCYGNPAMPLSYEYGSNPDIDLPGLFQSCHKYLERQKLLTVGSVKEYITDFAKGYENTRKLNAILGSGKRAWSLEYSEINLRTDNYIVRRFFMYGAPKLDDIKKHLEYRLLDSDKDNNICSIYVVTYQFGKGKPPAISELPPIEDIEGLLFDTHEYLQKAGLVQQVNGKVLM